MSLLREYDVFSCPKALFTLYVETLLLTGGPEYWKSVLKGMTLGTVRATLAPAPTTRLYTVWVSRTRPLTTATRIVILSLLERIINHSKDNTHYNPQRGIGFILQQGV